MAEIPIGRAAKVSGGRAARRANAGARRKGPRPPFRIRFTRVRGLRSSARALSMGQAEATSGLTTLKRIRSFGWKRVTHAFGSIASKAPRLKSSAKGRSSSESLVGAGFLRITSIGPSASVKAATSAR